MSRGHISTKWLVAVVVVCFVGVVAVPRLLPARDEGAAPRKTPPARERAQGAPRHEARREVVAMPEQQRRLAGAPETPFDRGEQAAPAAPPKPRATPTRSPGARAPDPEVRVSQEQDPEPVEAGRFSADELAAVAALRDVAVAQTQFQASAKADEDEDGVGQFGSFGELSGRMTARDNGYMLKPLIAKEFGDVKLGCVTRGGYRFRMFLPQEDGQPVPERRGGGFSRHETDPNLSEAYWCAYAWPAEGKGRTFFVNQDGIVLAAPAGKYSGDQGPDEYSAFRRAHGGLTAAAANGAMGTDHNVWRAVE